MRRVYQSRQGRGGDCLAAVIASLIELDLEAVPDFMAGDGIHTWPIAFGAWLQSRGLEAIPVARHGDLPAVLAHLAEHYGSSPYLLAGRVGDVDHGHVVIAGGAGQILHDPSPTGSTFLGGVPAFGERFLALILRPMRTPVLPAHAPVDLSPIERHEKIADALAKLLSRLRANKQGVSHARRRRFARSGPVMIDGNPVGRRPSRACTR
jgi:hypothetical protein